ncbi:ExeM/NucH family extracellular endonuclease [Demequina globuliformis]|uniref:ExeM/NucH family extracellular endonuclease n=1 Tax=Demequina globuliformis TaxID=676202 RepID=UPI0007854109|nr:ExeM/NucH family extracellular endonuclease [Demequina globuliformis]
MRMLTAMVTTVSLIGAGGLAAAPASAHDEDSAATAAVYADDLVVSEYVEGSGFNKAIEIYNGTSAPVDLSDYAVEPYQNGAASPSSRIGLEGTLAPGDVYVLASSTTSGTNDVAALADQVSGSVQWNGDDAVTLVSAGNVIDVLGVVGERPTWGENVTLRRDAAVCDGTVTYDASEWEAFASNTVDGLGTHESTCGPGGSTDPGDGGDGGDPGDGGDGGDASALPIGTVQGASDASPYVGTDVTVEGIVVGDYEGPSAEGALRGFYVQSRDGEHDDDPATSEALFVFNGGANEVALGDDVSVTGTVSEFQGQTQLTNAAVSTLRSGASVTSVPVELPFPDASYAERYEGMQVTFADELTVTEIYLLGRFNEVTVSGTGKLDQPTAVAEPGADAVALQATNDLARIKVDDARNLQNVDPMGRGGQPLSAANTLRGGDTVTGLTGVMTYTWAGNAASGNAWRVRPPSVDAASPNFVAANERPTSAPDVGGDLQVASFNVLNFFTTVDGNGPVCGPVGAEQYCRGADSAQELERQTAKLVAALSELDADVVGIMEMENTPGVEPLAALADAMNTATGTTTWTYVDTGVIGTDVIRVGLLYDAEAVSEAGDHAVLDSRVDERFDDDRNRPSLAQTFEDNATGETFTVVTNHWKSKGSCPEVGPDADQGDGAACWNETRRLGAEALVDWLTTHPTGVEEGDVLIMGDLNSYAQEDPIDVLREAGYVDLAEDYSYVFDGQWGSLDYVFGSATLAQQVTDSAHLHINADEPGVLDYNTEFKSAAQVESLYAPDMYRTSDHDPVLIGLDLVTPEPTCQVSYEIHGQWPGGFISQLWITNTGDEPVNGWDLGFDFTAGEVVTNGWSGTWRQEGDRVGVASMSWNGALAPGRSVTVGFVGSAPAGAEGVENVTLNGEACTLG